MAQIFPGQSLTAEPKNAPYERPPQMVKPEEAMLWHLNRITEPDKAEAVLDLLELELVLQTTVPPYPVRRHRGTVRLFLYSFYIL